MGYERNLEYSHKIRDRIDQIKDREVIRKIFQKAESLYCNPRRGKLLSGKPRKYRIRSLRFGTRYGEMRLLYQVLESEKTIYFIYVGTREEIYVLLKRWVLRFPS